MKYISVTLALSVNSRVDSRVRAKPGGGEDMPTTVLQSNVRFKGNNAQFHQDLAREAAKIKVDAVIDDRGFLWINFAEPDPTSDPNWPIIDTVLVGSDDYEVVAD